MVRKEIIFGAIIFVSINIFVIWFWDWHFNTIKTLERENKAQSEIINNLSMQIQTLIQDNKVTGFEEYFKGYKDENITNISNDFIF